MKTSTILKWVTGGVEAFFGIPVLGGAIIIGLSWTPLMLLAILHIIALVYSAKENENKHGSILGIITSFIAWIPFVGMIMHIITGIILLIDAARVKNGTAANL